MARDDYYTLTTPTPSSIPNNINLYVRFMSLSLWLLLSLRGYSDFILVKKKCMNFFIHFVGNVKWYGYFEDSLAVSHKTKHTLTVMIQVKFCSLVFTQNSWKTGLHTKNLHTMFMAALFIIVKIWKQPRCPLVDDE